MGVVVCGGRIYIFSEIIGFVLYQTVGTGTFICYQRCCSGDSGDLNYDGKVNLIDLAIMAQNWLVGTGD